MDSIEKYGRTEEEAIGEALKDLGADMDDVEITVLESGNKGFLGLGSKPWKVSVSKKFDPVGISTAFLKEITAAMGIAI